MNFYMEKLKEIGQTKITDTKCSLRYDFQKYTQCGGEEKQLMDCLFLQKSWISGCGWAYDSITAM